MNYLMQSSSSAYLFGRNEHYQLSHPLPSHLTSSHLTHDGIPSPTPAALYPFPLRDLPSSNVPPALRSQRIVSAAVGRGHTVLVTSKGEAWAAGWNVYGQCGISDEEHVGSFTRVRGDLEDEKVVSASCGTSHTLFLTESGRVYAVGTGEKGVLGNGKTGEHIAASRVLFIEQHEPLLVGGAIEGRKIIQITSGQQHNIALDDEGYCYAWGFGGLGRLGLGAQIDALTPAQIPAFAGTNPLTRCKKIAAGSTNTLFIDNQGMLLLCGKWKTSGDGSAGQPWMTPRVVQDIMGYKWELISAGGVTLFCSAHDPKEGELTVAWGQNAQYGELAFGQGAVCLFFSHSLLRRYKGTDEKVQAKSATKPQRIDYLDGIEMLDIAAGQNSTFFIARPPPTQAAKDEAKSIETAPAVAAISPTDAAPSSSTAADAVPATGFKPSIDLSGFGFSFGPPVASKPAAPAPVPVVEDAKKRASGISRTHPGAWEELHRFPVVLETFDECRKCGLLENPAKGESLECEKVSCEEHDEVWQRLTDFCPRLYRFSAKLLTTQAASTRPSKASPTARPLPFHFVVSTVPSPSCSFIGEWFCPECDVGSLEPVGPDADGEDEVEDDDDEPVQSTGKKRKAGGGAHVAIANASFARSAAANKKRK
ncbi:SPOSA6832_00479 [Sporobolomyces salmonicolor]|uniref:SPOSA6832_00479-mRNA-1:cds n=1 Tax=Sporidiobolus salmonicolor TaxID=5005 RepID=A0A0D6EGF7_SPOSA|nr:SPOSA6832_00479 [Sporobolomyces salmonicolor]